MVFGPGGALHRPQSFQETERVASTQASDELEKLDTDHKDEETLEQKLKEKDGDEKKSRSKKSAAMSLALGESKVKERVDDFAQKYAKSQLSQSTDEVQQRLKSQMDESLKSHFAKENQSNMADQVVLSQVAAQKHSEKMDQQRLEASDSEVESGLLSDDESQLQNGKLKKPSQSSYLTAKSSSGLAFTRALPQEQQSSVEGLLKRYMAAYVDMIVKKDPKKKQEIMKMREQLRALGHSPKQLKTMETSVRKALHQDLKREVRKSFVNMVLTFDKKMTPELLKNHELYSQLAQHASMKGVFGEGRTRLEDIKEEARADLRSYVADELDNTIIRDRLNSTSAKSLVQAFDRFNSVSSSAHFDASLFLKSFHQKLDDLGLKHFVDPSPKGGVIDNDPDRGSSGGQQGERHDPQGEIEFMEDEVRTLFLQHAVHVDIKHRLELRYQLFRMKGKLKDNQHFDEKTFKRLKEEGEALAQLRLRDLLREAFEERATLVELKGPEFKLVNRKIKRALKGLRRLGVRLTKEEIQDIKHHVNRAIFSIIKDEYIKIEIFLEGSPGHVYSTRKRKDYLAILERLREESDIQESLKPKQFQDMVFSAENQVVEAA